MTKSQSRAGKIESGGGGHVENEIISRSRGKALDQQLNSNLMGEGERVQWRYGAGVKKGVEGGGVIENLLRRNKHLTSSPRPS